MEKCISTEGEVFMLCNTYEQISEKVLETQNLTLVMLSVKRWLKVCDEEKDFLCARKILNLVKWVCNIDDEFLRLTNFLFLSYSSIVATTDTTTIPLNEKEIVILYGNYPMSIEWVPYKNHIKRHASYYPTVQHTITTFHPAWDPIKRIYILNMPNRKDRRIDTYREFAAVSAPLNRIHITPTSIDQDQRTSVIKGHINMIEDFIASGDKYGLICEDDISFISDMDSVVNNLETFFSKKYIFHVLFFASSKYHEVKDYDDLLLRSYQECTTASAYLINAETAPDVLRILREGMEKYIETKNHKYINDRYWKCLMDENNFFIFKKKLCFQRPSFSNLTGKHVAYFD